MKGEHPPSTFNFVNLENVDVTCWLYFFLATKNQANDPIYLMDQDLSVMALSNGSPSYATSTTSTDWSKGKVDHTQPGIFPNTPMVKKKFRAICCKKFVLQAGAHHELDYELAVNTVITKHYMAQLYATGNKYAAGITDTTSATST